MSGDLLEGTWSGRGESQRGQKQQHGLRGLKWQCLFRKLKREWQSLYEERKSVKDVYDPPVFFFIWT